MAAEFVLTFELKISLDRFEVTETGFLNSGLAQARAEEIMRNGLWHDFGNDEMGYTTKYPTLMPPARIGCIELVEVQTYPDGTVKKVW